MCISGWLFSATGECLASSTTTRVYLVEHRAKSDELRLKCVALAKAVECLQPGIDLKLILPIRFSLPAPLSNAQLTRAILAELRRNELPQCPRTLTMALLQRHELSLGTPEQMMAFSRQVSLRLVTLEKQNAVRREGDAWSL